MKKGYHKTKSGKTAKKGLYYNINKRKNYPKCVPAAKARSMSASQRAAAVLRKQKAERKTRTDKKPNYART